MSGYVAYAALFLELSHLPWSAWSVPSFHVTFSDVTVAVSPQRHCNCCGKIHFFMPILEGKIWEIKMLIAQQIIVTAIFPLNHGHQRLILHKMSHFQPFVKLKFSKKFSWGPPFAKMPKVSHFSSLGNGRLRCVRSIRSGAKQLSLKCLIRTFIPSNFQWRHSGRWPAAAFQLLR